MSPAKGYCTLAQVQAWHGGTLSATDQTTVTAWMEFAERVIDADTGNPFLTGPILGEQHGSGVAPDGPFIWTNIIPVASVQQIQGYLRPSAAGQVVPLTLGTDYEVDSLPHGRLWVAAWRYYA